MKRLLGYLLLLILTVPAWGSRRVSVGQLEDLLRSLQQEKKADADVATALKQVELTEELTRTAMNGLVRFVPGPLSTEQIYVLEARSADLIPPASDLPSTPAPDETARKSILAKAEAYIQTTYATLPPLTGTKTTLRFQDNVEAVAESSGISGSAKDVVASSGFSNPASFIHYINSSASAVVSEHGAEKMTPIKKAGWGANKMIALEDPDPSLDVVFHEAQASESLHWLRWELVNGRQAAVYAFAVPKKTSRLEVGVCCFPNINQAGIATFYTATSAAALGGGGSGGGVTGNFQTSTEWHDFKTTAPYHGEFFIDPETGIVLRMITEAELKSTDLVHELDTRVDYGAAKAGDKTLVVPVKTVVNTVVVPNGDSGSGGYSTRCTLFTSQYNNYQLAGARAQK